MKKAYIIFITIIIAVHLDAGEKRINVATLNWPPYIGQELEYKGYIYEIAVKAFERSGYKAVVTFYPWARAVNMVKSGEADVLMPEYYCKDREKYGVFSDPVLGGPLVVYKLKALKIAWKHDPVKEPEKALYDLRKYRFGVVRGYVNTKSFDAADFLIKEDVTNDLMNIKKLLWKRLDLIVIDKYTAGYLINKNFSKYKEKIEVMEPPLENKKLYLVFSRKSKKYSEYVKVFNRGLEKIKKDGTIKRIMGKYHFLN